jgi:hypothetical protein
MLTWHQANSDPFLAKAMLNKLLKILLNQVKRALTYCWRSEVTPGLLAGAEPEAHQI